ncbi:hypothetical protein ASG95_20495 [Phycicoccus sp. Soil803]|nr:hypothetical protein ASG95_20495 [Phycicoccus sp. Soil803]
MLIAAKKVGLGLLTLLVSSFIIFSAIRLVPGDPVLALTAGRRLTPGQIEALRGEYGLNEPFFTSYFHWLQGVIHLDFGESLNFKTPVNELIGARMTVSGLLIAYAAVISIVAGYGAALIAASRGGKTDKSLIILSSIATATPPFVSAVVLLSVFVVMLGWFPALGAGEGFGDRVYHLTLPAVALALSSFGVLARLSRTSFLEQLSREHVEVATSRGVPRMTVLRKHVVRNSLGPLLTLTAMLVSTLFVGTAVVETAFGIDGIGNLLVDSVGKRDMPVVQGIAFWSVFIFVVTSTLVEIAMPKIDPRLKNEVAA